MPDSQPPQVLDSILARANACYARQDLATAKELLVVAVELAPQNGQLLNALGSIQFELGDHAGAQTSFQRQAGLEPANADARIQLAMTLLGLKRFVEAEAALQEALRIRPGDAVANQVLLSSGEAKQQWAESEYHRYEKEVTMSLKEAIERKIATVGRWSYGRPTIKSWGQSSLRMGKYCSIADGVTILLGGEHYTNRITTFPLNGAQFREIFDLKADIGPGGFSRGDVVIGNDVWLAAGVTVMSGVKIGDGAVIGAGSIVTREVAPYAIAVGTPAKAIKQRFTEAQVARLLALKWWDLPEAQIGKIAKQLFSADVDALVAAVEALRSGR